MSPVDGLETAKASKLLHAATVAIVGNSLVAAG
jgi:hypothetical protein